MADQADHFFLSFSRIESGSMFLGKLGYLKTSFQFIKGKKLEKPDQPDQPWPVTDGKQQNMKVIRK